jgi:hypothetical protein
LLKININIAQVKYSQDHLYAKGEMTLRQNATLMYVIVFTWFERELFFKVLF